MDGANVEIAKLVGRDNIYIFGESSEKVIEHYAKADYVAKEFYKKDEEIREALDFMVGEEMTAIGHKESLKRLYDEILKKDWFMTLLDYRSYEAARERIYRDYEDSYAWAGKMLTNISKAGYFSSDRTISEYNRDIWKV